MSKFDLKGKTVVMTGASGGIGSEVAVEFAGKGAKLVLSGRNMEALQHTLDRVKRVGAEAYIVPADVTKRAEVDALVAKAIELTGKIDVMYLGAGYGLLGDITNVTIELWEQLMNVNFWGVLYGFYAALPHFLKQGHGQFIIMNTLSGKVSLPLVTPYCTSKFALWGFADGSRTELARKNINLIAIYPYFVKTQFFAHSKSPDLNVRANLATFMLGQKAENVAKAVVRASEKRKGEVMGTILGKLGPKVLNLSYFVTEYAKRILFPIIRLIIRKKQGSKA